MKTLTNAEIESCIKEIVFARMGESGAWLKDCVKVDVIRNESTQILIELTCEYESPCPCNDELLQLIKDAFCADNVEHFDDITIGGCETCDFGSQYGFAVRAWSTGVTA